MIIEYSKCFVRSDSTSHYFGYICKTTNEEGRKCPITRILKSFEIVENRVLSVNKKGCVSIGGTVPYNKKSVNLCKVYDEIVCVYVVGGA